MSRKRFFDRKGEPFDVGSRVELTVPKCSTWCCSRVELTVVGYDATTGKILVGDPEAPGEVRPGCCTLVKGPPPWHTVGNLVKVATLQLVAPGPSRTISFLTVTVRDETLGYTLGNEAISNAFKVEPALPSFMPQGEEAAAWEKILRAVDASWRNLDGFELHPRFDAALREQGATR